MIKMELAELPMISLQRQALTNFASSVWVKANKQSLRSDLEAKPLNDQAIAELKRSNIPTFFKEMTMIILTDVGDEIREWLNIIKDHADDTTLEHQLANLSWTIEGPLNRPKMVRLLLENQSDLDLSFSFKVACEYCLEDKVRELWPRVREERLLNDFDAEDLMVKYWIYKLDGHLQDITVTLLNPVFKSPDASIDVKFFLKCIYNFCYVDTVKFLFNSLNDEEKFEALRIFKSFHVKDYLFCDESVYAFLSSHFNVTEMCDVISRYDIPTLFTKIRYFAWPNTEFVKAFDQHVCKMKGTMEATNGNDLLKLAEGSFRFVRRYNNRILLRYCWTRFPKEALNEAMLDRSSTGWRGIFVQLISNNDDVSIKMVIDSIEPRGYAQYLLSVDGTFIISRLANYDANLLKFFLAQTVVSKNLAERLLKKSKNDFFLNHFKKMISDILIQLFPHWNLNCID